MPYNQRRMNPSDGFHYDSGGGGGMNRGQLPAVQLPAGQLPAASRLHQYLAANPQPAPYTPSFGNGAPININAPVFVPKQHQQQQQQQAASSVSSPPSQQAMTSHFANINLQDGPHQIVPFAQLQQQQHQYSSIGIPRPPMPPPHIQQQMSQQQQIVQQQQQYQQESRGGCMYFYPESHLQQQQQQEIQQEEEQYQPELPDGTVFVQTAGGFSYQAPLPIAHLSRFRSKSNMNGMTQFITPELRMELINRQLAFDMKPFSEAYSEIPQAVEHFSNLLPLENIGLQNQSTSTFKAISGRDGIFYCIRRIHGFRVTQAGKQTQIVEQWKKIIHGNIVPLREILINCRLFDESSLIFAYDYYPLAQTLMEKHFDPSNATKFYDVPSGFKLPAQANMGSVVSEAQLWTYIIQISSALRVIHSSGLACRTLDLTKIISYGNKVMISFCGISDIVHPPDPPQSIQQMQHDDLYQFGCILMALACRRTNAYRKDLYQNSMAQISTEYSIDFKNVIQYLTQSNTNQMRKNINEILPLIGTRMYGYVDTLQARNDQYEAELSRELENGRLFRLLTKLNVVLERAHHNHDYTWAETGDRYMLKLLRDYIFHQVTEQGKAWLDMAHIIQCLNKLDAGAQEKIEMVSRTSDTQIIIDYATLKQCLDKAYRDLLGSNMMQRH